MPPTFQNCKQLKWKNSCKITAKKWRPFIITIMYNTIFIFRTMPNNSQYIGLPGSTATIINAFKEAIYVTFGSPSWVTINSINRIWSIFLHMYYLYASWKLTTGCSWTPPCWLGLTTWSTWHQLHIWQLSLQSFQSLKHVKWKILVLIKVKCKSQTIAGCKHEML